MKESYLLGPVRTPQGRFGGTLRSVPMVELALPVGRAALERSGVPIEAVDELILSCRHQAGNGPNPGRTVALRLGLEEQTPAHTVNMACASGLKALALARQSIALGDAEVVLVVAADSMSTMPFYGPSSLRWEGLRSKDVTFVDGWRDGTDPVSGLSMGLTAENVAARYGITREVQDEWALQSHQRASAAWDQGHFDGQVVPIRYGDSVLRRDETIRSDTTLEKLAALRCAFDDEGTVTAGNASQMGDGAASIVVASSEAVARYDLAPMGRLASFSAIGVDPTIMGIGPTVAIPQALERAHVQPHEVSIYEINEAFGAQIVQNVRALDLDPERVNPNGGALALAHPTGQTGCRLVVAALHELNRRQASTAVVSLCVGGGQGVAAVVERV